MGHIRVPCCLSAPQIRMRSKDSATSDMTKSQDVDELKQRMSARELGFDPDASPPRAGSAGEAPPDTPPPPSPSTGSTSTRTPRGGVLRGAVAAGTAAGSGTQQYGKNVATMNAGATFGELALLETRGKGKRQVCCAACNSERLGV